MHTRRKPPRFALNTVFAATLACYAPLAQANPAGAEVVAGSAQLQQQGNSLVISNTPGTIINWQSFSIQPHELTRFVQQSAQSAVLNRVVGQDPSQILGQLQSNGQVFLINPNGVVFGQGAQVDVAGLLASTLNISDADFQAGKLRLSGNTTASVSNAASISTPSGGFVYLIAPNVHNHGVIVSPQGEVLLAAGQSVELVDGVDTSLRVKIAAPAGEVLNVGQLIASQGRIGIFATAIQQQGLVSANRAELGEGGRIVFKASRDVQLAGASQTEAQGGGSVVVDAGQRADVLGQIDVAHQTGKGGQITVLGEQIKVDGRLDASGATGGGTILLGGDYQGKNAAIRNAQFTELGSQARLDASAGQQGDGGKIIVWADQDTAAHGQISARGGVLGGNGGFAEVSGKRHLQFQSAVDLSAPKGQIGKLLLDPTDFIIDSTNVAALFGASADVTLAATQDVIFDASADVASTFYNISVQADRDINLQSGTALSSTGGSINLNAGRDVLSLGAISAIGDLQISAGHNVQNEAAFGAGGVLQIRAGNDIVQNALLSSNGNTLNLFANDSALCAAYGCVGTLTLNHDVTTFGLIDLSGKGITQAGGALSAGSGTVRFNAGALGISQSSEASLVADTLTINTAGDVNLLNVRAGSSAVALQATLADATDKQLNVRVQDSNLRIDGSGLSWDGRAALQVNNGSISQNTSAALGRIQVKQLDLSINNATGSGGEVSLLSSDNQIGQLSAQLLCATGSCSSAALDVRNGADLLIGSSGIRHEYGDVVLGNSGKIHLDNAGIETGNSGSGIYLYSTTSTLTGSGANAVLRSDLINLQRDVAGNGYAGAIGTAAPDQALQLAKRSGGEAISLYLGGSGASVAGAHIVSSDYLTVSSLNLGNDQTLFLQSADGMNLQNAGPINTGKADLSLHALGGELLLSSYSSLLGRNISLKSNGSLLLDNLTIDALETIALEAGALSSQWVEGTMSINAGSAISLAADNINLAVSAPIQAPKVSIQTRNAGVSLNLGGSDNEGVLGLSLDDLSGISTDLLALRAVGGSDGLVVSSDFTKTGALNLQAGGGIQLDANLSADQLILKADSASIQGAGSVTATGELVLNAAQGIFGADSGLRVSAQTIKASSSQDGQGAIDLETDTPAVLDLQTANSQISITALNGAELTVQQIQAGSGAVSLSTDGNLLAATAGVSIKGGDLLLSAGSIGSAAQRLETDASGKFEVRTSTGSSYVSELGGASAHILRSDGDLDLVLGGNVLLDDQSQLGTASNLRLDVGGNLSLLRANAFSAGSLNLSSTGAINSNALLQALNGPLQLSAQSIGAPAARVALSGATQTVSSTGNGALYLESNGGSLNLNSQGGLIDLLAMGDAQLTVQSQGGNVSIDGNAAAASLGGLIDAGGGTISLLTSGRLGDATQTDGRLRVLGASVNATAVDLYLDSQKNGAQLQLNASGGDLDVLAADGSQLAASSSADMRLQSNGTLQLGGLDASQGTLSVSATHINGTAGQSAKAADILLQASAGIGLGQVLAVDATSSLEVSSGSEGVALRETNGVSALQLSAQGGNVELAVGGDSSATFSLSNIDSFSLGSQGALTLGGNSFSAANIAINSTGNLNIDTAITAGQQLSLSSGAALNTTALLSAPSINLTAQQLGSLAARLQLDTAQLTASGANGLYLGNSGGIHTLSSQGGVIDLLLAGAATVQAQSQGGAVTLKSNNGNLDIGNLQAGAGAVSIDSAAQLVLNGPLQAGQLALLAGQDLLLAGTLNVDNSLSASADRLVQQGGLLKASSIKLQATNGIGALNQALAVDASQLEASVSGSGKAIYLQTQGGNAKLSSQGGAISLIAQSGNTQLDLLQSQGGAIQVQTLAGDLSLTSVQAGTGSVQLDSSGALSLGSLDSVGAQLKAGGALSYSGTVNAGSGLLGLTAGGAISSSGGLLKASNIRLEAVQGIGAGNALAVDSSQLSAHTTGSNAAIALNSQGGSAQLSTQDGDISLNSSTGSQVSASVGGQGRNLTVQAQSGDLQLQSLSVSGLAQLHALQGSLSGQSGTAWQAGQFALKAGQLNLNIDLNSSGSLMLDSLGAINAQGGRLTGSQITLRAAGPIGGANALQINTASLDAASSLAGAGIQLSGTAATAKLSSQGGDISWQAQGTSQVAANAGSGAIKASSDVALDGSFSAGSVQLSAQRLGSAAQRLQLDTLSADLQAAGELYADGGQRLASLQVNNSGSLTDFSGSGSYSATISSASNVVLHGGADIGLLSLNAKQVKLTALGSIQGLAGQAKQLVADTASLQAGGDVRLSSQVASLDLKAGANIDLVNHQALTLSGAQAGQDLRVESFGGLSTTGLVKSGGKLTLLTHSPLQIGSAGLEADGDLLLQTVSSGANDEITLNGTLNVLGNCEIQSAGGIQQNAGISTQGGSLLLNAAGGDLLMSAASSSQSNGGAIRYSALGNLTLALLDAGTGAVDLLASQGSISSALPGGMNVRAGALNAKAGGGILLRANVPADKLTLSSGSGVLDVRDASGAPYPGTTPVDESEQIGNESVQAVSILTALGNTQPSVQDQVEQLMNAVEQQGQDKDQPKKARKC